MTATIISAVARPATVAHDRTRRHARIRWGRTFGFHSAGTLISLAWFLPILIVVITAFRTPQDVAENGVSSAPRSFSFASFASAWGGSELAQPMLNSVMITIPTVVLSLLLSALAAFGLSRYRIPFWRAILLLMLAGNLLPSQLTLIPVLKIAEGMGVNDSLATLVVVNVAFGIGFYTFVLYGFMRAISFELQEAATLDGANPMRIFFSVILPLSRPALGALAALCFTSTFNELIWALTLIRTQSKLPITAAVMNMQNQYFANWSVVAAASVIAAVPTVIVFLLFQRTFISGLALGAGK